MEYVGNLYVKIGNKYFPIGKTADEVDTEIRKADAQAGRLLRENEELKDTIYRWRMCNNERRAELGYDKNVSFDVVYADLVKAKKELDEIKRQKDLMGNPSLVNLTTLFEIATFHGKECMYSAIESMLLDFRKTIQYPYSVSANNGDDIVYVHEDGSITWNTIKKD